MGRTDRSPRRRLDPVTRQAEILTIAAEAFGAQPYEQVSMAEVARQAGASEALLYRYFASKPRLYAEVLRTALAQISANQRAAVMSLASTISVRDRLSALVSSCLDDLAKMEPEWATALISAGDYPAEARDVRDEAREERLAMLRELPGLSVTNDYLLHGFIGFMDAVCLLWVERGCPHSDRDALIRGCLNALLGSDDALRPGTGRRSKFGRR